MGWRCNLKWIWIFECIFFILILSPMVYFCIVIIHYIQLYTSLHNKMIRIFLIWRLYFEWINEFFYFDTFIYRTFCIFLSMVYLRIVLPSVYTITTQNDLDFFSCFWPLSTIFCTLFYVCSILFFYISPCNIEHYHIDILSFSRHLLPAPCNHCIEHSPTSVPSYPQSNTRHLCRSNPTIPILNNFLIYHL